jgi:hypothetical protein
VWWINRQAAPYGGTFGSYSNVLQAFNCESKKSLVLQYDQFNSAGRPIVENKHGEWSYVVPDTLGEAMLNFVCASPAMRSLFGVSLAPGLTPVEDAKQALVASPD